MIATVQPIAPAMKKRHQCSSSYPQIARERKPKFADCLYFGSVISRHKSGVGFRTFGDGSLSAASHARAAGARQEAFLSLGDSLRKVFVTITIGSVAKRR
jgi:hypothetical protein